MRIGNPQQGLEYFRRAWTGQRELYGDLHPETLTTLHFVADAELTMENVAAAEAALRTTERSSATDSGFPPTKGLQHLLGICLWIQGTLTEAETQFQLMHEKSTAAPENEPDAIFLNNMSILLYDQGKFDEAVNVLTKALEHACQVRGDGHGHTVTMQDNLLEIIAVKEGTVGATVRLLMLTTGEEGSVS